MRNEYCRSAWRPPSPRSVAAMSSPCAACRRSALAVLATSMGRLLDRPLQVLGERDLIRVRQLLRALLQMKDVDRLVAFGRNLHELHAQPVPGHHAADAMQQPRHGL